MKNTRMLWLASAFLAPVTRADSGTPSAAAFNIAQTMYEYEMSHSPAEAAAQWGHYARSSDASVAAMAADQLRFLREAQRPLELSFTAIDGRRIDLKDLRGKVVLIDFWATWCPPCRAELPNVRRVYQKYHDRGFEIVGISCDVSPQNNPGATWTRTAGQVLAFTRAEGMPWPQQYEGRKHNAGGNQLAARFAVLFIPAAFLLDKQGRVVALNARGDRLDELVAAQL